MKKKIAPHAISSFEGYTLDELRYRLLVNRLKISFQKERLTSVIMPSIEKGEGIAGKFMPAMGKLDSVLKYADIAFLAFTAGRKITAFFKKRKGQK